MPSNTYDCVSLQVYASMTPTGLCNGSYDTRWIIWNTIYPTQPIKNVTTKTIETFYTFKENSTEAGLYKIQFFSKYLEFPGQPEVTDFVYIQFKLTGLVPVITDKDGNVNPTRSVYVGSNVVMDSSDSYDPADGLNSIRQLSMARSWTCRNGALERNVVEAYISSGTNLPSSSDCGHLLTSSGMNNIKEFTL